MVCVQCGKKVAEGSFCLLCGWNQNHSPQVSTLGAIYDQWVRRKHYQELSPKGKEGYNLAWKRLCILAEKEVQQVTFEEYQAILDQMAQTGLSKSSQEKVQQLISQLNKFAIRQGLLHVNLAPELVLEGKKEKESIPFADEHIPLLIEYASSGENQYSHAAMVTLCLIFTGYRPEELFKIRCEHLDPHIPALIAGSKTEAGKNRIVPILPVIQPYISKWYLSCPIKQQQRSGYLVRGPKAGKKNLANWREREFYPMTLELGINRPDQLTRKKEFQHITPYSARHTFATLAYRAGVDKNVLIRMIGHTNFKTTQKFYIHSELETMLNEATKIEAYLTGKIF